MIIDFIKVGQPMPSYIPLVPAYGSDYKQVISKQIQVFDSPCFSFVPFYPDNINYCSVATWPRTQIQCTIARTCGKPR